jgi:hypothetical protein
LADLKKQMATRHQAPSMLGFVEVPSIPAGPPLAGITQIELSRADGTRLCLHIPLATPLLEALVRAFESSSFRSTQSIKEIANKVNSLCE